jgi:hypothetical protein
MRLAFASFSEGEEMTFWSFCFLFNKEGSSLLAYPIYSIPT